MHRNILLFEETDKIVYLHLKIKPKTQKHSNMSDIRIDTFLQFIQRILIKVFKLQKGSNNQGSH